MAKPMDRSGETRLRELARKVERMSLHTHPGMVSDPVTITGSRSDASAILEQLLDALDAAGIIIDDTTD